MQWEQACSSYFQDGMLQSRAASMAYVFFEIVSPQITSFPHFAQLGATDWRTWLDQVTAVFQKALVLKCKLDAADAEYGFLWFVAGTLVDLSKMQGMYGRAGPNDEVVFTMFPGIYQVQQLGSGGIVNAASRAMVELRERVGASSAVQDTMHVQSDQ